MMTHLANLDVPTSWASQQWTRLSRWPDKDSTLIVVPCCGFADWGAGMALDAEEALGLKVLRASVDTIRESLDVLVTPPIRFLPRLTGSAAFSLDFETAYDLFDSILESIALTGFKKVVLYNTSPVSEPFIDVIGRDMRIKHELQMFCVNITGLGFDFSDKEISAKLADLAAAADGAPEIAKAADKLSGLFAEIDARAPLPDHGRVPRKTGF